MGYNVVINDPSRHVEHASQAEDLLQSSKKRTSPGARQDDLTRANVHATLAVYWLNIETRNRAQ